MRKIILSFVFVFVFTSFYGQSKKEIYKMVHDPIAKEHLDALSNKYRKHKTVRFYFKYTVYDAQDSSKKEYYGYLFVKDSLRYKIIIPEQEIFTDGIKMYSYDKKSNEMNITYVDPNSEAVYTPQKMLDIYKKGFKYSYRGLATFEASVKKNGKITKEKKSCYVVDLYPEKPKGTPYSIIRLWIDKNDNELVSAKYQLKNGIEQVVEILQTDFDVKINDNIFKFNKSLYPKNLDVIDFTKK
jgi:outer membrane lipoprotein-sorting protein